MEPPVKDKESFIEFPMGILGFEKVKRFVLLADPQEAPFAWLQAVEDTRLSFLVISPTVVNDSYNPDISEEEGKALGLKGGDDALVFNIVTLQKDGSATVNLKGPLVINRHTLVGKQVIPLNVADYSLQQPLNVIKS